MPDATSRLALVRSMRTFGNELELYVGAAGRESHMHRTDLTALAVVMDETGAGHTVTPGALSTALHLSAPATSAMLDRLERLGHVTRTPHRSDRRSVVVEMTDHAWGVGGAMFRRLGEHLAPVLSDYTPEEIALVADFLDRAAEATRRARASLADEGRG